MKRNARVTFGVLTFASAWGGTAAAQTVDKTPETTKHEAAPAPTAAHPSPDHWYDRIMIRGYAQLRFNRLYASSDSMKNDFADKSLAPGSTFFFRRARVILQGDIHKHVFIYLQPDFAGATNGDVQNLAQIRDWYGDLAFDSKKEFRLRVGQSKVPYGFENMQSSQNRAPFDRTEAINSALPGERELGLFLYYAPEVVRRRFKMLVDSGLKGSGDYGMLALGLYNGNGINLKDKNTNKHVVARVTYPFVIGSQILELGTGGYAGDYRITRGDKVWSYRTGGTNDDFRDVRLHASMTLYPKPIGLQAEYNIGRGPELEGKVVREKFLHGGYAMVMARYEHKDLGAFVPFVRYQYYRGGRKSDTSAPSSEVKELEVGLEWQIVRPVEVTASYMKAERTTNGKTETGDFVRLQCQLNY
ncbi:MAG: porin [Polyangiaceae bacterium]